MKKKICFLMIFVLLMSLLSACSHTNTDQIKKSASSTNTPNETQSTQIVTDDLGRKIEIPKNPQRIICFRSDDVGTLFAIGAGDKVVGRPAYEAFPKEAEKIPDVGVPGGPVPQPNMEKVLSLKPDLILMTTSITLQAGQWSGPSKDLVDKLENLHLKVVVLDTPKTVENNLEKIKRVGRIVGKEKEAVALTSNFEKQIKEITSKANESNYKPNVATAFLNKFYVLDKDYAKFIEMTGGNYQFSDLKSGSYVATEETINKNPDIIIVFYSSSKGTDQEACDTAIQYIRNLPGIQSTNAYKNNKIYGIKWAMVVSPGPRIVETVKEFAKYIHPEKF
ncbi:ABC transporter substrate-binding protein [Aceticella autotrophica]|uniref:ABC transporter substrate-binding protein n=1 Tax=Aceticella autotrophica TaxID=2755338 RepID=A0A975GB61_9THEO|nr:ABC transporter substrate-binding protein [Aceticella autotrophica]QSZ28179.1 ABC transporter substrate-binding protein [Aceticella autotrophica]